MALPLTAGRLQGNVQRLAAMAALDLKRQQA
jgi:hypothetical protein